MSYTAPLGVCESLEISEYQIAIILRWLEFTFTMFLVLRYDTVGAYVCIPNPKIEIMTRVFIILFLIVMKLSTHATGIEFSTDAWADVLKQAKAKQKIIFLDVYATWCGPCRHLEKNVFTQPALAEFYNEHFISKRIDAEREELAFIETLDIQAYPTLIFLDANGNVINRAEGAPDAEELLEKAKQVLEYVTLSHDQAKLSDPETMRRFLEILKGQDPLKAQQEATVYLSKVSLSDLENEHNWLILAENITDATNREWTYVLSKPRIFYDLDSDNFGSYLVTISQELLEKAVREKNIGLIKLKSTIDELNAKVDGDSTLTIERFEIRNTATYYDKAGDVSKYCSSMDSYLRKFRWQDSDYLIYYSTDAVSKAKLPADLNRVITWSKQALVTNPQQYITYWILAIAYSKTGQKALAEESMRKYLASSVSDQQLLQKVELWLTGQD